MEADLSRYHRADLLDLFRGRLSWRKLKVWLRHLPADSATVTALNQGRPVPTLDQHLLDEIRLATIAPHVEDRDRKLLKPHPALLPPPDPQRVKRREAAEERFWRMKAERKARLAAKEGVTS